MSGNGGVVCAVCHRPLRSAASIAAGVGPVCAGKGGGKGRRHRLRLSVAVSGGYDAGIDGGRSLALPVGGNGGQDEVTVFVLEDVV